MLLMVMNYDVDGVAAAASLGNAAADGVAYVGVDGSGAGADDAVAADAGDYDDAAGVVFLLP